MSRNKRTQSDNAVESGEKANNAEKAPKADHVANLVKATEKFVAATVDITTEADIKALQDAYRAIPAASRGPAMGRALKVNESRFSDILDIFNNLPSVTTSRTKVDMSDSTKAAILSVAILTVASNMLDGLDVSGLIAGFDTSGHESTVSDTIEKVTKTLSAVKVGKGRKHYTTTLADLVQDGTIPAGTVLNGRNDATCVVEADGTVSATVDGKAVSGDLSDVAGKFVGHSQNGWNFWRLDDAFIAPLRPC